MVKYGGVLENGQVVDPTDNSSQDDDRPHNDAVVTQHGDKADNAITEDEPMDPSGGSKDDQVPTLVLDDDDMDWQEELNDQELLEAVQGIEDERPCDLEEEATNGNSQKEEWNSTTL